MSSVDWSAVYEKLYGRPVGTPETKEQKLLKKLARDALKVVLSQSKPFLVAVAVQSDKTGVPTENLPYVFFVLVEQPKSWPRMPKNTQRSLAIGRDIMRAAADTPSYKGALIMPDSEIEPNVDAALEQIGLWCGSVMAASLLRELVKLFDKYGKAVERLRDDIPKHMGDIYIKAAFMTALTDNPSQYPDGVLLWRVLSTLLGVS